MAHARSAAGCKKRSISATVNDCVLEEEGPLPSLLHPSPIPLSLPHPSSWAGGAGGDHLPLHRCAPSACPQAPAICGLVVAVTSAPMATGDDCPHPFAENET